MTAAGTPFTQISEDMSENNPFPLQKSANAKKYAKSFHAGAGNKTPWDPNKSAYGASGPQNYVLETLVNELGMDHYYFQDLKIILVRINAASLDNPILANW